VPVVPFTLSVYWSSFYVGRPWYYRRVFWNRYWLRHPPVTAQNPLPPGTGPGAPVAGPGGAGPTAAGPGSAPSHLTQPPTRLGGAAQSARAQMGGMQSLVASAPHVGAAPRFTAGPAMSGLRLGTSGARSGSGGGFRRHWHRVVRRRMGPSTPSHHAGAANRERCDLASRLAGGLRWRLR